MSILACHKKIAFNFFDLPSIFALFWSYAVPAIAAIEIHSTSFFFCSCRARSRLGQSSKRLVVDQLFSLCKRTGEKQKARCLPKSKQNQPQNTTFFFCLMAAWLNEGRCPGGRPSVSTNYITIEASVFCIEMTTVHAIYKHRIKLAVSQRVPFG